MKLTILAVAGNSIALVWLALILAENVSTFGTWDWIPFMATVSLCVLNIGLLLQRIKSRR